MFDENEIDYLKVEAILKGEQKLTDKFDIEIVLVAIQSLQKKIDFLKELKKRRIDAINSQLNQHENDISILQDAILECMTLQSEKTLNFPGVGKVQTRKIKGNYEILDDVKLMEFLDEHNLLDGLIEESWKFKLKELYKTLGKLSENNNLPEMVKKSDDKTSLSISYIKDSASIEKTPNVNSVSESNKHADFDKLII